jgi:hypothetical protein
LGRNSRTTKQNNPENKKIIQQSQKLDPLLLETLNDLADNVLVDVFF